MRTQHENIEKSCETKLGIVLKCRECDGNGVVEYQRSETYFKPYPCAECNAEGTYRIFRYYDHIEDAKKDYKDALQIQVRAWFAQLWKGGALLHP